MNIIIDSNILFAALLKDSTTRKIILWYDKKFLFPEFIFTELEKYKETLIKKANLPSEEFNTLLQKLLQQVLIIPNETILPYKEKAKEIVKNIDLNDIQFVACALAIPDSIIWSEDKKLKLIKEVIVYNTSEITSLIYQEIPYLDY